MKSLHLTLLIGSKVSLQVGVAARGHALGRQGHAQEDAQEEEQEV
jgi:hypothetical protein